MQVNSLKGFQMAAATEASYTEKGDNIYTPILGAITNSGRLSSGFSKLIDQDLGNVDANKLDDKTTASVKVILSEVEMVLGDLMVNVANIAEEMQVDLETLAISAIKRLQKGKK